MKFFTIIRPNTNINFVGMSNIFAGLSILAVIGCITLMFTKGFNYGIDFTGGTVLQIKFNEQKSPEDVRAALTAVGEEGASVVALGSSKAEYLVTVRPHADDAEMSGDERLADQLGAQWGKGTFQILKADIVGPKVGKELKGAALRSLFYSVLLIMIFIWFRFDLKFAPGATLAMVHDIVIAAGFYILSGREFTITSIAALLTIAGYSVNDTIVIYDRVRELFIKGGDLPLGPTINKAINQTLSRTVVTSLTTVVAVGALIAFSQGELQSFAIAICVGVIVGTYSTLFVATPFTLLTQKLLNKKKA